ncbi:MAG: hypothetical protein EOM20_17575 [Spartobacteria bacterium]|nr:hypothetical protein [Spartobacteria bacterium]
MNEQNHAEDKSKQGFILAEVMVSSMIVGLVLAGILRLLVWTAYQTSVSGQRTVATEMLQEKMETLLNTDFEELMSGEDGGTPFTRTWTVAEGSTPYEKTLKVIIAWEDMRGMPREITCQSFSIDSRITSSGLSLANLPGGGP